MRRLAGLFLPGEITDRRWFFHQSMPGQWRALNAQQIEYQHDFPFNGCGMFLAQINAEGKGLFLHQILRSVKDKNLGK
jgi:hypothetical protein